MSENPFMTVDLGPRGGTLAFPTFENLRIWAEKECAHWSWVNSNGLDSNIGQALMHGQIYFRDRVQKYINQHASNPRVTGEIQSIFKDHIGNGKALLSTEAPGKFVLRLRESNPVGAMWALAVLTDGPGTINFTQVPPAGLAGFMQAMMFRHGFKESASFEREALEELHGEMKTTLGDKIALLDEVKVQLDKLVSECGAAKTVFQSDGVEAVGNAKGAFDAELESIKGRFAAIEKTYEDKLALQAPVSYWSEKAISHAKKFKGLAWSSGIAMVLAIVLITIMVSTFVPKVAKGDFPDPWRIGMVLITVTMLIWVIRLLVKVTLSQLHLQTDAEERTVLANAYLALLQRDQALRPEDREMVLQVLFRSAATGIVDDGGPATPIEIITKAVSGPRS